MATKIRIPNVLQKFLDKLKPSDDLKEISQALVPIRETGDMIFGGLILYGRNHKFSIDKPEEIEDLLKYLATHSLLLQREEEHLKSALKGYDAFLGYVYPSYLDALNALKLLYKRINNIKRFYIGKKLDKVEKIRFGRELERIPELVDEVNSFIKGFSGTIDNLAEIIWSKAEDDPEEWVKEHGRYLYGDEDEWDEEDKERYL